MPEPQEKSPIVKWGAIAVIALMLLSGVAVYFAAQSPPADSPDTTPPADEPVRTLVSSEVEATVKELFPSAVILGQSSQTDKSEIDAAIGAIVGVRSVRSQFTQLDTNAGTISYLGEISLDADANTEFFVENIFESSIFSAPEIYFQAVIEIPLEVQAQTEEGKTETVQFPSNEISAFVNVSTRVNDIISGPITVLKQSDVVRNAYMFESQNVTQSPKPLELLITAPISELQPKLIGTGIIHYVPSLSRESLMEEIASLQGISGVQDVFIPFQDNVLRIQFANNSSLRDDLNAFVQANPSKYVSFSFTDSSLEIGLGNISLSQAKSELRSLMEESLQTTLQLSFIDPESRVLIDMNTSSSSTGLAAEKLFLYFSSLDGNHSIKLYQPVSLSIENIPFPDSNSSLSIPDGNVQAYVFPGHALNEIIAVTLSGTLVNNEIVEISGLEVEAVSQP